jgi:hypothetical protein
LNADRSVIGGVHEDHMTAAEPDLPVAAVRVLHDAARAVLDLAGAGAESAEQARFALDLDGPRVPVRGPDHAELPFRLGVGQDDLS